MPSQFEIEFIYSFTISGIIRLYWTLFLFSLFLSNIGLGSLFSVALRRRRLSFALRSLRDVRRLHTTLL